MTYTAIAQFTYGDSGAVVIGQRVPDDHPAVALDLDDTDGRVPGQLFRKDES